MKKYLPLSINLFALATIAFGIIEWVTGDFNKGLLPVPATVPGRTALAYSSAAILCIFGGCILVKRFRNKAAFGLGIVYLLYFVLLHLVKLSAAIYDGGEWTAAFEVLLLCSGSFLISGKFYAASRYALAACFLVFAALHFNYADYIATLIPAWFPARLFLAYFIGVIFLLTAICIVINFKTSIVTASTGCLFFLFVITLHIPRTIGAINAEPEWTSLFVALAAGATCFILSCLPSRKK